MASILYPGTFDPITLGHINLIERASRLFERVSIAIAASKAKSPLFNIEERQTLCEQSLAHLNNVNVIIFDGLIIDLVKKTRADAVLRGVRTMTDFDYEFQMATTNQHMLQSFETLFLTPTQSYSFISSTLVREIASMHGDVSRFVSDPVLKALQAKFVG